MLDAAGNASHALRVGSVFVPDLRDEHRSACELASGHLITGRTHVHLHSSWQMVNVHYSGAGDQSYSI